MRSRACVILLVVIAVGGAPQTGVAGIAGCPVFPADSVWNARIDTLPLDPRSAEYINAIGP